jgi:hypothetical protein
MKRNFDLGIFPQSGFWRIFFTTYCMLLWTTIQYCKEKSYFAMCGGLGGNWAERKEHI